MAGWIYVALCSLTAPQTLSLPLTHVLPYLREDTAGVASFIPFVPGLRFLPGNPA